MQLEIVSCRHVDVIIFLFIFVFDLAMRLFFRRFALRLAFTGWFQLACVLDGNIHHIFVIGQAFGRFHGAANLLRPLRGVRYFRL